MIFFKQKAKKSKIYKNYRFQNFKFFIIYIIHKMLGLIKNHLNYLKDSIFEYFFKKYNCLLVFKN